MGVHGAWTISSMGAFMEDNSAGFCLRLKMMIISGTCCPKAYFGVPILKLVEH